MKNKNKILSLIMMVMMMMTLTVTTVMPVQAASYPKNKLTVTSTKNKISGGKITVKAGAKVYINSVKYGTRKGNAKSNKYTYKKISTDKVKWKTSNKAIATVKNGTVTTKKPGKVTITATYKKLSQKVTIKVNCKHKWNSGKITKQPTCKATGVKTYTCTVCKTTKTNDAAKVGHCYSDGKCKWCGVAEKNVSTNDGSTGSGDDKNNSGSTGTNNPPSVEQIESVVYTEICPKNNGGYHVFTDEKATGTTPYKHACSKCGLDIRTKTCNSKDSTGHYWDPVNHKCWVCGTKQPYFKADVCVCFDPPYNNKDAYCIVVDDNHEEMIDHLMDAFTHPEKYPDRVEHVFTTRMIYIGDIYYSSQP